MKNFKYNFLYLLPAAVLAALTVLPYSCRDREWDKHGKSEVTANLLELIKANRECSAFYQALVATGQDALLEQSTNFTVLAPANSAWESVRETGTALEDLVKHHIAYDKSLSDRLQREPLHMVSGKVVRYDSKTSSIGGAVITSPDNAAANGVLHVIDKPLVLRSSIWEYVHNANAISRLEMRRILVQNDYREMDREKSLPVSFNNGQQVYDTVWMPLRNRLLDEIPLDNEQKEYTFLVLEDFTGFLVLREKYEKYLKRQTLEEAERLASFHICRDMVFEGNVNIDSAISNGGTLTSVTGVKVSLAGAAISSSYQASNGKVYVLSTCQVDIRSKVQPVLIEGESFVQSLNNSYIYTRYKPDWASGEKDIMLSCRTVQSDTLVRSSTGERDSIISSTFYYSNVDGANVNATNFWIEYKAEVFSTDAEGLLGYEIYYVAYNDIQSHAGAMRLEQKLFISLPDADLLSRGGSTTLEAAWITNNYLGNLMCFASLDTAGVRKEKKMRQWNLLNNEGQTLSTPYTGANSTLLVPPRAGELTLRLCNTPRLLRSVNSSGVVTMVMPGGMQSGMLFLDYIKLVPIFAE